MAILELQENGNIQMFYNKWWKNSGTCNQDDKKQETASSLDISNVGGIFVVLFVGLTLAIFVAVIEFLWNARKTARDERVSVRSRVSFLVPQVSGFRFIMLLHVSWLCLQQSL